MPHLHLTDRKNKTVNEGREFLRVSESGWQDLRVLNHQVLNVLRTSSSEGGAIVLPNFRGRHDGVFGEGLTALM